MKRLLLILSVLFVSLLSANAIVVKNHYISKDTIITQTTGNTVSATAQQQSQQDNEPQEKGKNQLVALVLALIGLIGVAGLHRFYLGYIEIGIIQLLTGGLFGIWTIIDIIRIATGELKPKDGYYAETL